MYRGERARGKGKKKGLYENSRDRICSSGHKSWNNFDESKMNKNMHRNWLGDEFSILGSSIVKYLCD